jgi:hypothetical protein
MAAKAVSGLALACEPARLIRRDILRRGTKFNETSCPDGLDSARHREAGSSVVSTNLVSQAQIGPDSLRLDNCDSPVELSHVAPVDVRCRVGEPVPDWGVIIWLNSLAGTYAWLMMMASGLDQLANDNKVCVVGHASSQ